MKKHTPLIVSGSLLAGALAAAPALAAANGPRVSVRVEGLTQTLLPARSVTVPTSGSITKGGVKPGQCPADSVQGALQQATSGHWKGVWFASYKEYEVTGIAGVSPNPKKDYFELFVNNVAASAGACDVKVKPGDQLLFAVVPVSGVAETPLSISWRTSRTRLIATVRSYNAAGRSSLLKGATVRTGTTRRVTGAAGTASFPLPRRTTTLVATAAGHVRDETTVRVAH